MSKHSRVTSKRIEDLRANMQPISDKCKQVKNGDAVSDPCQNINDGKCTIYAFPESKWRLGNCVKATHVISETEQKQGAKKRVGQQKQKKKR